MWSMLDVLYAVYLPVPGSKMFLTLATPKL